MLFDGAPIMTRQAIFFVIALILSQHSLAQLSVLACEPEWAALVSELGGDQVSVSSATTAMQDPHHIQARPSLIAKARNADLLVCTGAELEIGWLPVLLQKSGNPKIQSQGSGYFMASDYVELLGKPTAVDRSMGDVHMAGNPHIHTSPQNMLKVAAALTEKLSAVSPGNKALFENNHQRLRQSFDAALVRWQPDIHALNGKKLVVHHDYWLYLENWLQLRRVAVLEPKPGVPPSSTYLASLLGTLQQEKADMILQASYNDNRPAAWLSGKTGIPVVAVPATLANWQEPGALIQWYDTLLAALRKGHAP